MELSAIQVEKKKIRNEVLHLRDALTKEEQERACVLITERILGHQWFYNAEVILGFVSYGSEIETGYILEEAIKKGKDVYVPKVMGEEMLFFKITSLSQLERGYKGILEPKETKEVLDMSEELAGEKKALMIMPGVAFDLYKNRIGYGKGFYDRFLRNNPYFTEHSIAIGHKIQMVDKIPEDELDVKPYQIICV